MRGAMMSLPKEKREALLPETSALDVIIVDQINALRALGAQASACIFFDPQPRSPPTTQRVA